MEQQNYVLKADISSNYWFGISKNKLQSYKTQSDSNFNIILFGSELSETDFYVIPISYIEDLLISENLYLFNGRERWVGDIRNHILRIRNSKKERNISEYFSTPLLSKQVPLIPENQNDYAIENAKREVLIRINQSLFRQRVLANFQEQCCLTQVAERSLLVASHIIPWSAKIETRLSPHNGLCLSVLYDRLFDRGFLTINDDFEVIVTSQVPYLSLQTQRHLTEVHGKKILAPRHYEISKEALKYHRENIFERFDIEE
ncbi:MAG: HNH endonuclease [Bacteroidetes bacterium]|nr:HNH endonuclease [Bacteroidota bacterium]